MNVSRYVLSTTHLHEFKSADKGAAPVMSLYLPEQKLGSHSSEGGSSNKFILKGRQTGAMHRGHTWVFRAESHDTMIAWYEDIKTLTEKSPEERHQFVRTHSRSLSRGSRRSMSSDGIVDEDDDEPFSANQVEVNTERRDDSSSRRPQAGGRFPSDLQVNAQRGLEAPQSPSSMSSGNRDINPDAQIYSAAGAAGVVTAPALAAEEQDQENHMGYGGTVQTPMENMPSQAAIATQQGHHDGINPYTSEPVSHSDNKESSYFAAAEASRTESGQQPQTELPAEEAGNGFEKQRAASASDSNVSGSNQNYINGSAGDASKPVEGSVPRSEAAEDMKPLELVPENEPTAHMSEPGTVGASSKIDRKTDDRTNSMATISNLPIPGQFPKSTGVKSS